MPKSAMPDMVFPERRTRSQLALPDDILKISQRSPMKDAKKARSATRGDNGALDDTEDELLLSPRKREGRSKRSATPEPQDEYSTVFGSPSCSRVLKRVKCDTLEEKDVDDTFVPYTRPLIPSRREIHDSETSLPANKGKSRKRSATMSKGPMSTVSASPPPSVYSPLVSPKGRAQSVPLLTTTVDFPRIDFRNPPPTPVRSGSSPVKEKLRITSGPLLKLSLPPIADEQNSTVEKSDGSTRVLEEKELPLIQEPIDFPLRDIPVIPATPMTTLLNKLIPMSPLTPIAETPFPGAVARDDTASRYDVDTGWTKNLMNDFESSASPSKAVNPPCMSNSRLPRPIAPPSNRSANPPQPSILFSGSSTKGHDGRTVKKHVAAVNAFDLLMQKPLTAKAGLESKTNLQKGSGTRSSTTMTNKISAPRIPKPSIFTESEGEKPAGFLNKARSRMRERMRPRPKSKMQKPLLLIPMVDDDEESTTGPDVEHSTGLGSVRKSPDPDPSTLADSSMQVEEGMGDTKLGDAELSIVLRPSEAINVGTENRPSRPTDEPVPEVNQGEEKEARQPGSVKVDSRKLHPGKKRLPITNPPVGRVTRSASKQKDQAESSEPVRQRKSAPSALKRTASGKVKKSGPPDEEESAVDTNPIDELRSLSPGSPMKTSSPAKTPPRNNTTDEETQTIDFGVGKLALARSPARLRGFSKPASTPSPSKIARATSMFIKPTITNVTRNFSTDSGNPVSAASGSLFTLSNALEKLRMPAPSRPNTSMGFNEEFPGEDNSVAEPSSKDDSALNGHSGGLKRSATLGSVFRGTTVTKAERNGKVFVQKPLSAFMSTKGAGRGSGNAVGSKLPRFGIGGPIRRTISKKTDLPMVVGSPVKGGNDQNIMDDVSAEDFSGKNSPIFFGPLNASTGSLTLDDLESGRSSKGKEKAVSTASSASRRVSMMSHALSQSLSSLPQSGGQGLMGPPPTPPAAQGTTGSPSTQNTISSPSSSPTEPSTALGTRTSARIAMKSFQAKMQDNAQTSSARKDAGAVQPPTNSVPEGLKILNDCVIFVDVRTDEGDEAGSLFVEMLEGVGAKILSRVGQTCTHIVYTNGLMSTLTRYRLLRDPKPLVVDIGWVVECVEQWKHVDETPHLIDLDGVNVAGINKRRRSILPKLLADATESSPVANENGDEQESEESMNLSASRDDLAPLERARRRKSMIVRPHW